MTYPETSSQGFIFNSTILIAAIIIINLILIIIRKVIHFKSKFVINEVKVRTTIVNFVKLRKKSILKIIPICLLFGISLILMCLSALYSNVPNNDYNSNYVDYRSTLTFFHRVPPIFYLFFIVSIFSLILIIYYGKNNFIKLLSISVFIYCLWILPYLQIKNYFSHDTYLLFEGYQNYLASGLVTLGKYNFSLPYFNSLRYSTDLCTAILLTSATNINIDFALWYLYPLLYIFIPFFFYSVFKKYTKNEKNEKNELFLIILVIFSTFIPYLIKSGHATGTGLLGVLIYTVLILEFYDITKKQKLNTYNFLLIIILYTFLCLTHTEETIYFLIFLMFYYIYYTFHELKKINIGFISKSEDSITSFEEESRYLKEIVEKELNLAELRNNFIKLGFLLFTLSFIFYLIQEFFGWVYYYLNFILGRIGFFDFFLDMYLSSLINISFFLRGGMSFSYLIIVMIFLGIFLSINIIYYILFKKFNFVVRIYSKVIKIIKRTFNFLKKIINKKLFPYLFFSCLFLIAIFLESFILQTYEESVLLTTITIIISYFVFILQILFFLKGIEYYNLKNNKQNFFLLAIIASAAIIPFLLITGDIWLSVYFIHSKFSTNFIFFNLIIIQNTYIRDLKEKKHDYLLLISFLIVFLGVFYCLRKLAFG